jgi:uncharacterized protein (TIGR00369 family)
VEGFPGWLGIRELDADDGTARLEIDAGSDHLNQAGVVHGGVLATLVDSAMGLAARSTGGADGAATSQLTVTYLTPGQPGRITVTAQVRKQGEHLLVCDADAEQDGRTLVHAVATFAVLHR